MGTSQYASSFGRLQSIAINFLSEEFLQNLLKANTVTDMVKQLESTWYGEEIKKSASVYKEAELLEVAFNRHIVETNNDSVSVISLPIALEDRISSIL